jgi:hypothetical protein
MDNPEILAQRTKTNKHKNRTQVNKTMSKADHAKNRDMNPCAREGQPMVHNGTNIKVEWYTNEITLNASNWGPFVSLAKPRVSLFGFLLRLLFLYKF